jgi:hypothetical protein
MEFCLNLDCVGLEKAIHLKNEWGLIDTISVWILNMVEHLIFKKFSFDLLVAP